MKCLILKAFGFQFVSQFHCCATYRRKSASDQKKVVANQMGNTNFALTTDGYQMVVDWSLGLCDSGLIDLTLHCHHNPVTCQKWWTI